MTKKNSFILKMTLLALLLACVVGFFVSLAPSSTDANAAFESRVINSETYGGLYLDSRDSYLKFSFTVEENLRNEMGITEHWSTITERNFYIFVFEKNDTTDKFYDDCCNGVIYSYNETIIDYFFKTSSPVENCASDIGMHSVRKIKTGSLYDESIGGYIYILNDFNPYKKYYAFGAIVYYTYEKEGGDSTYHGYDVAKVTPLVEYKAEEDMLNVLENPPTGYGQNTLKEILINTQQRLGIYHEEDATININYIKSAGENTRGQFSNVTKMLSVPSYMLQAKDKVIAEVQNSGYLNDLNDYNVVEMSYLYKKNENGNDESFYTGSKIIRQAINYEYTYDSENNTGTIEIIYSDFFAKDLYVRVSNNDPENNLSIDIDAVNVKTNNGQITATFLYQDICTEMQNLCGWLPGRYEGEGDDKVFVPGILKDNVEVTVHGKNLGISVSFDDTGIYITCAEKNQNALALVQLDVVMMLIEDIDLMFSYRYVSLNDKLEETVITSTPEIKKYSKILAMSNKSFMEKYGELINEAINPASLNGEPYMSYVGIEKIFDKKNQTYIFNVEYEKANMLVVNNNLNETVVYKVLDSNSLVYTLSDFVMSDFVPKGYRISKMTSSDTDLKILDFSDRTPLDTQVCVTWNTSNSKTVYVTCNMTDKWVFDIEYFSQYKNTPFLEKKIMNKEIRVLDYENLYELSVEELKTIMGIETFDLLNLATAESLDVTFMGNGYNVKVNYSHASLKKTDYNGNIDEVKVYITPYSDWTESFNKDWSILFLNTPENEFFQYSNDVDKENLYGFFSVAVMKERVTDLNRLFSEYSATGCKTVYQSQEVSGSKVYKFFGDRPDGIKQYGMIFCEIFNSDNNIYHSYFFYLDGTSKLSFLATNGADSYDDESSAFQNKWENFTDGVADVWDKIDSYVYLVLAIAGIILGLVLTVKLMSIVWAGTMQITFKIITTVVIVGVWVVIGIIVVPWAVGLIGAL